MKKAPSFQFYAQDFLTGVVYLTNEEIGIYIKMLCKQWTDEKIPKKRLGLLVGYEWIALSDELKSKFKDKGEYVVNKRLEVEREKKIRYLEQQKLNGQLGGRPKKSVKLKNPNVTQKKPLEEEEEDRKGSNKKKKEIIFPWDSKNFIEKWDLWKIYKKDEFGFKYKSMISEQGALKKLANLSDGQEQTAIDIIYQSIESGWKGLFKLQNDEKINQSTTGASPEYRRKTAERLGIIQS